MVFFERSYIALRFWLLKLGISVLLAVVLGRLMLIRDLLSPAFTALLCIRGTFFTGLEIAFSQVKAGLAGAGVSLVFTAILGQNVLSLALSVMAAAYICLKLYWEANTTLVLFTLLYAHLLPLGSFSETVLARVEGVVLGVVIATAVNWAFSCFRYRRMYYFRLRHAIELLEGLVDGVAEACDRHDEAQLRSLEAKVKSLARLSSLLHEEASDLRRELRLLGRPGDLEHTAVPRIELLAGRIESASWHLKGVVSATVVVIEEGQEPPARAGEQLRRVRDSLARGARAFRSVPETAGLIELSEDETRLPFFGMPVPEITLLAELVLLRADAEQVRFHAIRFLMEFGSLESEDLERDSPPLRL